MSRLTTSENGTGYCNAPYCQEDCNTCMFFQAIRDKLAHYEDLEEAGRLIVLPCATDERVWVADGVHEPWQTTYTSITQIVMDMVCGWAIGYTKAEAEAKLAEGDNQ